MSEHEVNAEYAKRFGELCNYLKKKFPRLDRADCEELAQITYMDTLERVRRSGFRPEKGWWQYFRWLASKRALDCLDERIQVTFLEELAKSSGGTSSPGWEPPAPEASPSELLRRREQRPRQQVLLSQVLKEYCRHCEERPERLKQKEVYERALRGQRPAEIAQAMDITRNSVDQHLHRARKWIMERVRQADVHHSVFSSLQCL